MRHLVFPLITSLTVLVDSPTNAQAHPEISTAITNVKHSGPEILKEALKIEAKSNDRKLSMPLRDEYSHSYHIEIKRAFECLVVGAKDGDLQSMFFLGAYCRTFNKEGLASVRECLPWLEAAAIKGHPEAPYDYAEELLDLDTPAEKAKGFEWLKRATETGDLRLRGWAAAGLATRYTFGDPVLQLRRDPKAAWNWIRKGAKESGCSVDDLMIQRGLRNPDNVQKGEIQFK